MPRASSVSSGTSQDGRSISLTAFSVPTRQGVHWPQLSSSKNRIRFSVAALRSSWSERIDDRVRADEAAVRLELAEVERDVGHRGRQDAARGAARQVGAEAVAFRHAAAELVDQLARRDAGRRQLDARLPHPARDRVGAQPLAAVPPLAGEPGGPLLDDVPHPEQRLDIVDQRRPAEQRRPGRRRAGGCAVAALALDALDHRGLFAADVGPRPAAQLDEAGLRQPGLLERRDLVQQDLARRPGTRRADRRTPARPRRRGRRRARPRGSGAGRPPGSAGP